MFSKNSWWGDTNYSFGKQDWQTPLEIYFPACTKLLFYTQSGRWISPFIKNDPNVSIGW